MSNEDLLRMAIEANFFPQDSEARERIYEDMDQFRKLEKFAALVQAATAEECAKVCTDYSVICRRIYCGDEADTADALASGIRTKYQDQIKSMCAHEWVDARNAVVQSGEICLKCNSIREGNQHPTSSGEMKP